MAPRLSGRPGRFDVGEASAINVTPLVGVMLLLVLTFMIAAPLATSSISLNTAPADRFGNEPPPAIWIHIGQDQKLSIDGKPSSLKTLTADVRSMSHSSNPTAWQVLIRADRAVPYKDVVAVMGVLKRAGYVNVGLIAEDL